jgi:L-threonylcarbamoyladenylate synthase
MEDMDGKIQCMVDGGPCAVGVESTILDLTCDPPRLLRPGGLPMEQIEQLIGPVAIDKAVMGALAEGEKPKAPGMKYRHYAPKAPVTVVAGDAQKSAAYIAEQAGEKDGIICFDEFIALFPVQSAQEHVRGLGPADDKEEQARHIFDALRAFDHTNVTAIWAQCPDTDGIGLAIANRLNKAAGFHIVEV